MVKKIGQIEVILPDDNFLSPKGSPLHIAFLCLFTVTLLSLQILLLVSVYVL